MIYHALVSSLAFFISYCHGIPNFLANLYQLTVMSPDVDDLRPPLLPVTENDHGPWVITVSTILLILTIIATVIAVISRMRRTRNFAWSDLVLILGCVREFLIHSVPSRHRTNSHRSYFSPKLSASMWPAQMESASAVIPSPNHHSTCIIRYGALNFVCRLI